MVLSRFDLEEIAVAVISDFYQLLYGTVYWDKACSTATPIDQFASQYLGLHVSYVRLSADGRLCGLTAYANTEYQIREMGVVRHIPLRQNQILLDSQFIQPGKKHKLSAMRRFTLAHECAHQILFQLETDAQKSKHKEQYSQRSYSLRDLKAREDWNEWQANVLGAAILMPQQKIDYFMRYIGKGRKLKNYENQFSHMDQVVLTRLCHVFEVSRSAAVVRLHALGYIENYPRSEYVDPLEILA